MAKNLADYSANNPVWQIYLHLCQGDKQSVSNIIDDWSDKDGRYQILEATQAFWYKEDAKFINLITAAKSKLSTNEIPWLWWLEIEYYLDKADVPATKKTWREFTLHLKNSKSLSFLACLKHFQQLKLYLLEQNIDNAWSLIQVLKGRFNDLLSSDKQVLAALLNYYYAHVGAMVVATSEDCAKALEQAIGTFHELNNRYYLGLCYLEYANHEEHIKLSINHLEAAKHYFHETEQKSFYQQTSLKIERIKTGMSNDAPKTYSKYLFESRSMGEVLQKIERIVQRREHVLILGPTGTGKEVVANTIHQMSRPSGDFVSVNCASLPRDLISSELFGYEQGAFTGAIKQKKGLFEQAEGGTLFLDEFGDIEERVQATLLRVMQEGVIRRVGGKADIPIQVRVIAATNKDVDILLRDDLLNRFVWTLRLAPLSQRQDEILPLAQYFISSQSDANENFVLSSEAKRYLLARNYPGNIRDLQNCIIRAIASARHAKSCIITESMLKDEDYSDNVSLEYSNEIYAFDTRASVHNSTNKISEVYQTYMHECEQIYLFTKLKESNGNKIEMARLTGLHRSHLYRLLQKHNLLGVNIEQYRYA